MTSNSSNAMHSSNNLGASSSNKETTNCSSKEISSSRSRGTYNYSRGPSRNPLLRNPDPRSIHR